MKIERISERIKNELSNYKNIVSLVLVESPEDGIYDPYFVLSFDAYYTGDLPDIKTREKLFSEEAAAFESSISKDKDRFLVENLPIRIEYKNADYIKTVLEDKLDNINSFAENGTYLLYRIVHSKILFDKNSFIKGLKEDLNTIDDDFWNTLLNLYKAKIEHYLNDVQSAAMRDDKLFFTIAAGSYINTVCSFMFIINREYEPSKRSFYKNIKSFNIIPEHFKGRFECLLRDDQEFNMERKSEVSKLLSKSLMSMQLS